MTTSIRKTMLYLLVIQGGNYLFPLLLLPYLGRVLGVTEFGVLAYCQAIVQYLILLTDYGHNLTATRLVSVQRHDPAALSTVYSATMAAKLALSVVSLLLLLGGVLFIPGLSVHWPILVAAFVGVVANAITPVWLFQGLEQMKSLVLPTFISKIASFLCVVLLVKGQGDAALAALGISLGNVILAVAALWMIHRRKLVSLVATSWTAMRASLGEGFPVFLSLVLVSFYVNFNSILLNYFHGPTVVGQFAMADKIRVAAQALFMVIGQAFYPRISHYNATDPAAAQDLMRTAMLAIFGCAFGLFAAIQLLAGWGVELWLGEQFHESIFLLRLEAVLLPVISVAFVFGNLGLLALGRMQVLKNVYAGVTILHLLYVVPLTRYLGAEGTILSVILTESVGAAMFALLYFREVRPPAHAQA
jgi:polysaccharide transporter, PST family